MAPSPSATAALPPRGGRPHRAPSASRAQLLLSEALGRPAQAEEPPTLPPLPHTEADLRALAWDQLKALAVAYPEIEYMPEAKRQQWLVSRWIGLTQAHRDNFRAALDMADATRAEHSVA